MPITRAQILDIIRKSFFTTLIISVLIILYRGPISKYALPALKKFLDTHVEALVYLSWFLFILCSSALVFIVWWAMWADQKTKADFKKYVSKLVCPDYYRGFKKIDYQQAIHSVAMKKYTRDGIETDEAPQGNAEGDVIVHRDGETYVKEKGPYETYREDSDDDEDKSDGRHEAYHKNGKLAKEYSCKGGKFHGIYRTFYDDGSLRQEKFFTDGKMDGVFKAYDQYGILYFEISYRNGIQDGEENTYYKNGIIQYKDTYLNGKRTNRKTYSEQGELLFDHDFHN